MSTEQEETLTEEPTANPEEILADIAKEQRQLDEKGVSHGPKSVSLVSEPEETIVDPALDKSPKPGDSTPAEAPVPFDENDKTETEDWMKRKGFKNVQAMAQSLRDLERELHRRAPSQTEDIDPQPVQPARAAAPYQTPPVNVDAIAKQYGVDPDDLQRIGRISNDIASFEVNRQMRPVMAEMRRLNQEVEKRSTYDRVQNDPTFNDPTVLKEMHEIVEKNPSVTKSNPYWMKSVHNMALTNIGRRYLERGIKEPLAPVPAGQGPNRPPPSKGGSGSGVRRSPLRPVNEVTPEQFAKLPLAEQEKQLKKAGAWFQDE